MLHLSIGGVGAFAMPINTAILAAVGVASLPCRMEGGLVHVDMELPPGRRAEIALDLLGTLGFEAVDDGYEVDVPVAYAAPAQLALGLPDARLRAGRAVWRLRSGKTYGPAVVQGMVKLGLRVS